MLCNLKNKMIIKSYFETFMAQTIDGSIENFSYAKTF